MFEDILGPYVPKHQKDCELEECCDEQQMNPVPDGNMNARAAQTRATKKAWNTGSKPKGVWRT